MQISDGLKYTWTAGAVTGSKVSNLNLGGAAIVSASGYRVTLNSFLADGGEASRSSRTAPTVWRSPTSWTWMPPGLPESGRACGPRRTEPYHQEVDFFQERDWGVVGHELTTPPLCFVVAVESVGGAVPSAARQRL